MTRAEWAEQIWVVLVGAAYHRHRIEYTDLARLIGFEGLPHWLSDSLGRLALYCHRRDGWPILPAIVVNQSGQPGPGIPFVDEFAAEQARAFAFDWDASVPHGRKTSANLPV